MHICYILCTFASQLKVLFTQTPVKLFRFFRILSLSFVLFLALPVSGVGQKRVQNTTTYVVKPGETVLGIAHRHGTTLDNMLRLNPGLKADYVQAGQTVIVPAGGQKTSTEHVAASQIPASQASQDLNPVLIFDDRKPVITYKEYKVKRKDTAYSLAKANNITVEDLMEANPAMRSDGYKLKKGTTIRIPVKTYPTQQQYKGLSTIRVAIVLPFSGSGVENVRSVEFYRGLLMGISELKKAGKNVIVSAWEEPAADKGIAQLLGEVTAQNPDVIIGPLYPGHFNDVTSLASKKRKVAIPFFSNVPQVGHKENVFVVNTPAGYEKELMTGLFTQTFGKNRQIVFLSTKEGGKKDFCTALESQLVNMNYNICHTAITSTASEIKALLGNPAKGAFLLVPDDDSETTLKQLFDTSKQLRTLMPGCEVSIAGYENWIALSEKGLKQQMHEADTYVFTPNYYFPYTSAALSFDTLYKKWFKTTLLDSKPRMAPLGYDFARVFLGGLAAYGYDYGTQAPAPQSVASQAKLQTDLRFARVKGGGFVSRSMWLVHFKNDLSIVKLSAQ